MCSMRIMLDQKISYEIPVSSNEGGDTCGALVPGKNTGLPNNT